MGHVLCTISMEEKLIRRLRELFNQDLFNVKLLENFLCSVPLRWQKVSCRVAAAKCLPGQYPSSKNTDAILLSE